MNITLNLPDDLSAALRAHLAATGDDLNNFAVAVFRDALLRGDAYSDSDYASVREQARREAQGTGRRLDINAILRSYGLPTGRTEAEVAASAEAALEELSEETRAEMKRQGFL